MAINEKSSMAGGFCFGLLFSLAFSSAELILIDELKNNLKIKNELLEKYDKANLLDVQSSYMDDNRALQYTEQPKQLVNRKKNNKK